MVLPPLLHVRQRFDSPREEDVSAAVHRELAKLHLERTIRKGDSVALTAGSRGIAGIDVILRETVGFLQTLDARPFIVPAMGSHGGGTAAGQTKVLESYGITEERVGAPIRASMDVVTLSHLGDVPIHLDRIASEADHIGVVARVKPHTSLTGRVESGLVKMMMIGLGKHQGALAYHRHLVRHDWEALALAVAPILLEKAPIAFALGIVENALDQTALIEGVSPGDLVAADQRLLEKAKQWMARLPFRSADVLIIDEIGKDISGAGLDPNVLYRKEGSSRGTYGAADGVRRIVVRGLSAHTHGNATGVGMADFTTRRLVDAMDYHATVTNCLTANRPDGAAIPVHFPSDRQTIEAALKSVGLLDPSTARVMWIRNTLWLESLWISANYDVELAENPLDVIGPIEPEFDGDGNARRGP